MTLLALGHDSELVVQGGELGEPFQDLLLFLDRSVEGCNVGGLLCSRGYELSQACDHRIVLGWPEGLVDFRMRRFHKRHRILQGYPECSY